MAPIIYLNDGFFVFGGQSTGDSNSANGVIKTIGYLHATKLKWSNVGEMKNARAGHNVIWDGFNLVVVGGNVHEFEYMTERCNFVWGERELISCYKTEGKLKNYSSYPELVLVPKNFCRTCV